MMHVLKNSDGYVYAYVDAYTVDHEGVPNKAGRYVYVCSLWIHEKFRGLGVLKALVALIDADPDITGAPWVYWKNERRNDRSMPLRPRASILKLMGVNKEKTTCLATS